jgi:SOS response regulatory protein OraA/RecX
MDAYTTALTLLARRELSTAQLRMRLARRQFGADEIEDALARLASDRALDDRRVALAAARTESTIRRSGRRRVLQRVQQLGINVSLAKAAVDEVFEGIDEEALLDAAIERKLKGAEPRDLDEKAKARIVRSLVGQGFEAGAVYAKLK